MSTFTVTKLAGHRSVVAGTDDVGVPHTTILDSTQWDEIQRQAAVEAAKAGVDTQVEAFFAPIVTAIKAAEETIKAHDKVDPAFVLELVAGVDQVNGRPAEVVKLTKDSVILRLLDSGDHSRLIWVGDTIEILAV